MIDFKDSGCPPGDVAGTREPKAEELSPSARPRSGHEPPYSTISEFLRDGEPRWHWTVASHKGGAAASHQAALDQMSDAWLRLS